MTLKNSPTDYGTVTRALHWVTAFLILGIFIVGLIMGDLENSPFKFQVFGLHKSLGITVLLLAFARLGWHVISKKPPMIETMQPLEKKLAISAHHLLYLLMIVLPISGWAMSSAGNHPVTFFGLFQLPNLVAENHDLKEALEEVHEVIAYGLVGLAALHAAAALKHHFIAHDATLKRMLPFLK